MIKRTVPVLFGFLCVCLPLLAQLPGETDTITREQLQQTGELDPGPALALHRSDVFSAVDGSVLIHGLPVLALLDGRRILVANELGRMGFAPLDIFPVAFLSRVDVQKISPSPMYGSDTAGGVVDLRLNRDYYGGGEVGVFYGKSGGRYGREDFQSYFIGGVGNDKIHFTAGAVYEETNGRGPRFGR